MKERGKFRFFGEITIKASPPIYKHFASGLISKQNPLQVAKSPLQVVHKLFAISLVVSLLSEPMQADRK